MADFSDSFGIVLVLEDQGEDDGDAKGVSVKAPVAVWRQPAAGVHSDRSAEYTEEANPFRFPAPA